MKKWAFVSDVARVLIMYRFRDEYATEKLIKMGMKVIIGANSTVTHDMSDNLVVVRSPAKILCRLDEYIEKDSLW